MTGSNCLDISYNFVNMDLLGQAHEVLNLSGQPKAPQNGTLRYICNEFLPISSLGQGGPDQNAKKSENMLVRDWLIMYIT